jgi:hypothetical protein
MGKKLREKYPRYRLLIYGEGYDVNKLLAMCSLKTKNSKNKMHSLN